MLLTKFKLQKRFFNLGIKFPRQNIKGSYLLINNIDIDGNKKELNISVANGLYSEKFKPKLATRLNKELN